MRKFIHYQYPDKIITENKVRKMYEEMLKNYDLSKLTIPFQCYLVNLINKSILKEITDL
ncbi:MAG TPA: hypothetical protein VIK86_07850 [Candidatus Paceibacterota bacterium]